MCLPARVKFSSSFRIYGHFRYILMLSMGAKRKNLVIFWQPSAQTFIFCLATQPFGDILIGREKNVEKRTCRATEIHRKTMPLRKFRRTIDFPSTACCWCWWSNVASRWASVRVVCSAQRKKVVFFVVLCALPCWRCESCKKKCFEFLTLTYTQRRWAPASLVITMPSDFKGTSSFFSISFFLKFFFFSTISSAFLRWIGANGTKIVFMLRHCEQFEFLFMQMLSLMSDSHTRYANVIELYVWRSLICTTSGTILTVTLKRQ